MSYHYIDVLSQAFSPRDWQVELLAAAKEKNIIICLSQATSKHFITLKLIHELGHQLRNAGKKTLLLANHVSECFSLIEYLTDLKAVNLIGTKSDAIDWDEVLREHQVVLVQPEKMLDALVCSYLDLETVNLIVLEDCHRKDMAMACDELIKNYFSVCEQKPKILGLAGPLHNAGCPIGRLGAELECLERTLLCQAETASDIVTVLRYSSRPKEVILQCAPSGDTEATAYLKNLILTRKSFINDHRYDPTEIYEGEEFVEELKAIPDPKVEPLQCLDDYLQVLEELGVWCADRACLSLLIRIEKLKVKTPYERHFLLLCMVGTTLVQARAYCDYVFQSTGKSVKEIILDYSSPKIRRLIEILKLYQPSEPVTPRRYHKKLGERSKQASEETLEVQGDPEAMLDSLAKLDLGQLTMNVDNISKNIETIATGLDSLKRSVTSIIEVNGIVAPDPKPEAIKNVMKSPAKSSPDRRNPANRGRNNRRKPMRARNHQNSQDSDTLCGLIFCSSKFITRILFTLLLELTRNDPDLAYLCVQYILDKATNPAVDAKEADAEHRKQEEVLKRFRMRDCNLLIGTAVLEEGIDLPKCNLVIRWDPPTNYRSYVQCKGRARAYQALYIIMVAPQVQLSKRARSEYLTNKNHRHICGLVRGEPEAPGEEEQQEDIDAVETASVKSELSSVDDDSDEICNYNIKCVVTEDDDDEDDSDEDGVPEIEQKRLTMERNTDEMIELLAQYMEIEKMLLRKCENTEPAEPELQHADRYTMLVSAYNPKGEPDSAQVTLANAVSLINKYCAKLPSDTFTKLTPLWRSAICKRDDMVMYQCTLRLPINSPIKYDVLGVPMPTRILARRVTAFTACKILHMSGELDDNLQPIGKEGFRAIEPDWENFELDPMDEQIVTENVEPRPGTTKRRQYYFKRIAGAFSDCRPKAGTACYLYSISLTLQCPIPEEQNTRGRKIYPPEDANQSFGILTLKRIPKISAFPIFTRSGEVRVALELIRTDIVLDETQIGKINTFINYTFTNVLRLQKYLMLFDADAMDNCFFIVPTVKVGAAVDFARHVEVDWAFLETIQRNVNMMPQYVSDEVRKQQPFDANRFKDAVVMPWYRNQDQPQYFYVAEICYHLSPDSLFPGENYSTFKEYYSKKYGIEIQNARQPLLDVDHTSARLNFLTPRYVNRKGVALPTSSEETKKAKRENLEQKQILVPELCTIHPFPASLWRTAVCLPCILYRINALLLADEIRKEVSHDLGLGRLEIEDNDFQWPVLDFGWSLADVLKRSREVKLKPLEESATIEEITELPPKPEEEEKTANELLEEADKKLKADNELEIGTWSNELAEYDSDNGSLPEWGLPGNISMCSRRKAANVRYGSPTTWVGAGHTDTNDQQLEPYSDTDSYQSDDECLGGGDGLNGDQTNYGLNIEFKSDHLAEAIESEEDILKREKKLAIINRNAMNDQLKTVNDGFDCIDVIEQCDRVEIHEGLFKQSMEQLKEVIRTSGMLVRHDELLTKAHRRLTTDASRVDSPVEVVTPYDLLPFVDYREPDRTALSIDQLIEENKKYMNHHGPDHLVIEGTGDQFDQFNDCDKTSLDGVVKRLVIEATSYDLKIQVKSSSNIQLAPSPPDVPCGPTTAFFDDVNFSFDEQPDLHQHPGPSPSVILQGLTMSNANDGINLERLETIGDSFLKYAITTYLYCTYENVHEGKLSHLRSKQVSNLNLYRLGRRKVLGESMIATKFEPHDNWLPPCYYVPKELEQALIDAKIPACYWNLADLPNIKQLSSEDIIRLVKERAERLGFVAADGDAMEGDVEKVVAKPVFELDEKDLETFPCFIPYNLVTQHSIPDKSIADCVEALIGAYLIDCGPRGALLFMAWLGIRVLPIEDVPFNPDGPRIPGSSKPFHKNDQQLQSIFGYWLPPKSPLLTYAPDPYKSLDLLLDGYDQFEAIIGYKFKDRSYLLQAMTHASYTPNRLTDCYQRLEFLGDAVLDYLITRHLFEDPRQHSPGALTDLRSALVNNTIFASLAVRHNFHKYFRHLSPGLNEVIDRFVRIQNENGHVISEEFYLISEEECDEAEDVEVPKALGDVFESVAGAIFLDSNMSLDCVWKVYSDMMKPEIEQFSSSVPKSPIRELLELEPETAKFGKPEKLADGRRVRVTVEVFGKGVFRGIGRNYRIAKCTAAKCALRQLKKQGLINKKR